MLNTEKLINSNVDLTSVLLDVVEKSNIYFGVDITSQTRKKEVVVPRQIAMTYMYSKINVSYQDVSNLFNLKSHGTTINAIKKTEDCSKFDEKFSNYVRDAFEYLDDSVDLYSFAKVNFSRKSHAIKRINSKLYDYSLEKILKIDKILKR